MINTHVIDKKLLRTVKIHKIRLINSLTKAFTKLISSNVACLTRFAPWVKAAFIEPIQSFSVSLRCIKNLVNEAFLVLIKVNWGNSSCDWGNSSWASSIIPLWLSLLTCRDSKELSRSLICSLSNWFSCLNSASSFFNSFKTCKIAASFKGVLFWSVSTLS